MDYREIASKVTTIPLATGLYVTATPIGHAGDLTLRALETLLSCDLILCEDTRVTSKLLSLYGIEKPLRPYHDRNGARMRPQVLSALEGGKAIVLVSDAGMPLISDPGFPLLAAAREAGFPVEVLPGANAALTALTHSGLAPDRFYFGGFLPTKSGARQEVLKALAPLPATLIFYESPKRLGPVLADMAEILSARDLAVCRELTKRFEEIRRGTLEGLAGHYRQAVPPKGEVVLVVSPPADDAAMNEAELRTALRTRLAEASLKDTVAELAAVSGWPKRKVYELALELKMELKEGMSKEEGGP